MGYYGNNDYRDFLAHHGILGMHWGIRRYQSYDVGYQRKGGEDGVERISGSRSSDGDIRISRKTANRVKKVVTAAALIGAGYWVGKHPDQAKKAADAVSKTLPKIGKKLATTSVKGAKVTAKFVVKQAPKAAKATVSGGKRIAKALPDVGKKMYAGSKSAAKIAKNGYDGAKSASKAMAKVGKKTYRGAKTVSKGMAKLVKKIAASGETLKTDSSSIGVVNKAKNGGDSVYGVIKAKKGGSSIRAVLRK